VSRKDELTAMALEELKESLQSKIIAADVQIAVDPKELAEDVEFSLQLACWLNKGLLAKPLFKEPAIAGQYCFTFWEDKQQVKLSAKDKGHHLNQFHENALAYSQPLPQWRGLKNLIRDSESLSLDDRYRYRLYKELQSLLAEAEHFDSWLGWGPILGEVDFSSRKICGNRVCFGPRELDLFTAGRQMSQLEQEELEVSYGFDLRAWSGYQTLVSYFELRKQVDELLNDSKAQFTLN
jgi:hypothetical protein